MAVEALILDGRSYDLAASVVEAELRTLPVADGAGTAAKVVVGAAAGALLGRLLGGDGRSAATGAVAGAAAGTAAAMASRDEQTVLEPGAYLVVELSEPLEIRPGG